MNAVREITTESCGCSFRVSNGTLLRGCRRHDPQAAGRIVGALEDRCRKVWRWQRDYAAIARSQHATPTDLDTEFALRSELRTLLRIRRAGRRA